LLRPKKEIKATGQPVGGGVFVCDGILWNLSAIEVLYGQIIIILALFPFPNLCLDLPVHFGKVWAILWKQQPGPWQTGLSGRRQ